MFGFDNSVTKLDDYPDFYSVEPIWIDQMKRVENIDKLLQGASTASTKPKRKSNSLFTMMGKPVGRQPSGACSSGVTKSGVVAAVVSANTEQQAVSAGGGLRSTSSTVSTPGETSLPPKRAKILPQQGSPWICDSGGTDDGPEDDVQHADNDGSDDGSANGDSDDDEVEEDNIGDWKSPLSPDTDTPDVNDIEGFLACVNDKKMLSTVHQNLFTLMSFLALDACYFGEPIQDNGQLYENAYLKFMMVFNDSMLASSYWCENFYGFLPEGELPLWWKTKIQKFFHSRKIKKRFRSTTFCKGQPEEKIVLLFNGQTIYNKGKAAMREINNRVNNLWKDPRDFPSGTTKAAVMHAIRERAWPKMAEKKSKKPGKTNRSQNPNWGNMTLHEKREDMFHYWLEHPDNDWYPDWWLTFLLCGKPAGSEARPSLNSGHSIKLESSASYNSPNGSNVSVSTSAGFQQYVSRRTGRAMAQAGIIRGINDDGTPWAGGRGRSRSSGGPIDLTDESPGADAGSRRSTSSSATSLTVQHVLPAVDLHQRAVETLGEQIATVKDLLADAEDEEEKAMYKSRLTELRKRKLGRLDDVYLSTLPGRILTNTNNHSSTTSNPDP